MQLNNFVLNIVKTFRTDFPTKYDTKRQIKFQILSKTVRLEETLKVFKCNRLPRTGGVFIIF